MTRAPLIAIDPSSSGFKRNPYSIYAHLRKAIPVSRVRLRGPGIPAGEAFLVARHQDVSALLKDPRFTKDPANAGVAVRAVPAPFRPLAQNMLAVDDPDHARLKRLVQASFSPGRIAALTVRTEAVSSALLDRLSRQSAFDLIEDYALPLPVAVISELLGVPQRDRRRFARWSNAFIRGGAGGFATILALPEMIAFLRYLKRLVERKRAEPADDLISALIAAETDGDRLDAAELLAMIAILLSAGHETTANLIGNGALALLEHPEAADRLRSEPALIELAVEELLRFSSPLAMSTHRYAREPLVIAGTEIPPGSLVFGLIASANRDAAQFPLADRLDITRAPNRHLTFGEGGHYCVGAALARMEGRIALRDVLTRFTGLRLAVQRERLSWKPGLVLNGLEHLPLSAH